jgi:hypothetical protein
MQEIVKKREKLYQIKLRKPGKREKERISS